MGFLTVNGKLMTYDEYKHLVNLYRAHGVMQFMKLYNVHKDRQIAPQDLHWGEEIEYMLYQFDRENNKVQLTCDAGDIIDEFNEQTKLYDNFDDTEEEKAAIEGLTDSAKPDFKLLPEFGNWMIEAVPRDPYGTYLDPDQLLACKHKI